MKDGVKRSCRYDAAADPELAQLRRRVNEAQRTTRELIREMRRQRDEIAGAKRARRRNPDRPEPTDSAKG